MSVIKRLLFSALFAPLLGGGWLPAAEFEVLDKFSVDGYSVLRGTADIVGGGFTVGGSSFVVKGGNVGIGTESPGGKFEVAGGSSILRGLDTQKDIAAFGSASGDFKVVISTSGNLDVAGGVKLGNVSACTADKAGTIRWSGLHFEGCTGTAWRQFDNQPPPTISVISPASGLVSGGTPITISGSGFNLGLELLINGVAATVTGIAGSQITATTPVSTTGAGSKTVNISNPDGQYCTGVFTYNPFITTVLPASGPRTTVITITGGGFAAGAGVKIGTVDASNIVRDSETQLRATIPAGYVGGDIKDVTVINGDATSAVKSGGFTYRVYATGGDISNSGQYRIHTYTTGTVDKTFTVLGGGAIEVLVVAGGGGGAASTWGGGGGGAGGILYHSALAFSPGPVTVTVGAAAAAETHGNDSLFGALQAFGGGNPKSDGGSGSGCPHSLSQAGGNSIQTSNNGGIGYGNKGGDMVYSPPYWPGSGGGAGAAGTTSGDGGAGKAFDISGTSVYYAGGGGLKNNSAQTTGGGVGGGGGACASGLANTGGGGGGCSPSGTAGGGGSGIVIARYVY